MTKAITYEGTETREKLNRLAKNAKNIIDELSDDDTMNSVRQVRATVTGKTMDQQKMLKRKMKNCDNDGWISLNRESGQYPNQVHVTLKTGLFELFQGSFLELMKEFNIHPKNRDIPEESTKITLNNNGIERVEYDLSMNVEDISADLKVKIYSTTSSFDVQGLKPHFSSTFKELGNKTIAVYFVDVVLESIYQSMRNNVNLEEYNEHLKSQAKLGLEDSQKTVKKQDVKARKSRSKINAVSEKKCDICESNSKEINSFKCHECDKLFHKQCVSKRTSAMEFALLKKGDLNYNCETCIKNRIGIDTFKALTTEITGEVLDKAVGELDKDNTVEESGTVVLAEEAAAKSLTNETGDIDTIDVDSQPVHNPSGDMDLVLVEQTQDTCKK